MKNFNASFIIFSIIWLFLSGCSEVEDLDPPLDTSVSMELVDEPYGNHPRQAMDVYLPANRSSKETKILVWIHGGAWTDGDKSEFSAFKERFENAFEGYAFVSLNYRLFNITTGSNRFPNQEEDVMDAIEYIKAHASKWGVSSEIVIAGASAGGHLALLHAYKNNPDKSVKAVVAFFPPTDFNTFHGFNFITTMLIEALHGGGPSSQAQRYIDSSPVKHINNSSVPTVFFHGTADNVVPIQQSQLLEKTLKDNNIPMSNRYVQGAQHGFSYPIYVEMIKQAADFIHSQN
ncbi:prolyl oligopeptidase family serine peptidase [Belliella kenyensis]|uniref:Prolyl oligopeptidase family serine peptidase n=1 Tax=Belliella kenyensis TaxID=1472724 RepID=A0ABV8ER54_9BACT|nr:alpha/beta hydrolase [Belliella kenyensis]MCH7401559.1 alpha/beta hydrolase [Belliella kenyensis]MDN3603161.1 alpha/beta hydrolase [Belliella kenyensis]